MSFYLLDDFIRLWDEHFDWIRFFDWNFHFNWDLREGKFVNYNGFLGIFEF